MWTLLDIVVVASSIWEIILRIIYTIEARFAQWFILWHPTLLGKWNFTRISFWNAQFVGWWFDCNDFSEGWLPVTVALFQDPTAIPPGVVSPGLSFLCCCRGLCGCRCSCFFKKAVPFVPPMSPIVVWICAASIHSSVRQFTYPFPCKYVRMYLFLSFHLSSSIIIFPSIFFICLSLFLQIFFCPTICLFASLNPTYHPWAHLFDPVSSSFSVCWSIGLRIDLSSCRRLHVSLYLSMGLSINPPSRPHLYVLDYLFLYPSVLPFIDLSIHPSIHSINVCNLCVYQ